MAGVSEASHSCVYVPPPPKKSLLSIYYVSGTVLGTGFSTVNKTTVGFALLELTFWWEMQTINKETRK